MEELEYNGKRYRVTFRITPTTRVQECTMCSASIRFYAEEVTPTLVEELSSRGEVVRKLEAELLPSAYRAMPNTRFGLYWIACMWQFEAIINNLRWLFLRKPPK